MQTPRLMFVGWLLLAACPATETGSECVAPKLPCGSRCFDLQNDRLHCGSCDAGCAADETCSGGACSTCAGEVCGNACADLQTSVEHCGACNAKCEGGTCVNAQCRCPAEAVSCPGGCFDLTTSRAHCGACGHACDPGLTCESATCVPICAANEVRCDGGSCAALATSALNCGACGHACQSGERCQASACVPCSDCDLDGWASDAGDCCDGPTGCPEPTAVNPGAREIVGNNIDDNCNGLLDTDDVLDVAACDGDAGIRPTTGTELARALGLCRTTVEGAPLPTRTWGVVSAELLLASGVAGVDADSATMRPVFGTLQPLEGGRLVVLASGLATDAVQTNPGPDLLGSHDMSTTADLRMCTAPACIQDWLDASRPPLKSAGKLPEAPNCGGQQAPANLANDSVMLRLRIRAPTNAASFSVKTRFFSIEYPEFVCTAFNDQVVLLIDTPGGNTSPRNPSDKNLMTFSSMGKDWPIGINLASGTGLFQSCTTQSASPSCWDTSVSSQSCKLGSGDLAMTQFAAAGAGACINGGGTGWLVTVGNVRPGEIFELRAAVWDVGDHILDSYLLMDDFRFSVDGGEAGTSER